MLIPCILNIDAGKVQESSLDEVVAAVRESLLEAGIQSEIHTCPAAELHDCVAELLAANPETIIVAGGDGTIHSIGSQLVHSTTALAILPLGTFNLFANDFNIDSDLRLAARQLAHGTIECIDAAQVNGRVFLYNSLLGLHPRVIRLRDTIGYAGRRAKILALIRAFFFAFFRYRARRYKITSQEQSQVLKSATILVGPYPFTISSTGVQRRSSAHKEALALSALASVGRLGLLKILLKEACNIAQTPAEVIELRSSNITIEASSKALNITIDGEPVTMKTPLRYEILPKALRVVVPKQESAY